jgi:outer membrane protein OmpA-like peptidoglycan-associated protein
MGPIKTIFAAAVAVLVLASAHAENLRETLFTEADSVLAAAQEKKAFVLSPEAYRDGYRLYKKAEASLEKGRNIASIQRDLDKAIEYFEKAIENTKLADVTFTSVMKARADADKANARQYAAELWKKAEAELIDAAEELEDGDVKDAKRGGAEAESIYRKAELAAIKGNYLSETEETLKRAENLKVYKYAPKTLEKAKRMLSEAEQALTENRYDIDKPRDLARQAKYEAAHAIYLTKRIQAVEDDEQTMEELILDYESAITRIAGTANIVAEMDRGYEEPTEKIVSHIEELQDRARQQAIDIEEMEAQLGELSSERASLKKREALQKQADRVDRLFTREEANVLRKGDDIILRLIGLNFASGKAEIESKNFRLLSKVQNAIDGFSGAELVVEGHTDSFGSDASNRTLSQKRAESVRRYLIENMKLNKDDVSAVGYGETVPVANNETPEGRQKNRRIDIVIKPRK